MVRHHFRPISPLLTLWPRLVGTVGAGAITFVLGAVSGILLARMLGPTDRGHLALLLLWPQLISTVGILGIDLATTYFAGHRDDARDVTATALRLAAVRSAASGAVYAILIPVLISENGPLWIGLLLILLVPIDMAALVGATSLNGRHDHRRFNLVRLVMPISYTSAVVILSASDSLTVTTAAISYLVSNLLTAVMSLWFVSHRYGLGHVRSDLADSMSRFGLHGHFGRLTPQLLGIELAIVGLLVGAADAGLFAAATAFLGAGRLITTSTGFVVYPEARAARIAREPATAVGQTIASAVAVNALVACGLWLFGGALAGWIFGSDFRTAGLVAAILGTGEVAWTAYALLVEALRGNGQPMVTSVAQAVSWVLFLPTVILAAAVGGLIAVAAAVAAVNAASLCVLIMLAARNNGLAFLGIRSPLASTGMRL